MATMKKEKKKKNLIISRAKGVNAQLFEEILGKRIKAQKVKYGVVLTSYTHGGFSVNDAITIANLLNMTYNGRCIR